MLDLCSEFLVETQIHLGYVFDLHAGRVALCFVSASQDFSPRATHVADHEVVDVAVRNSHASRIVE